MITGPDSAAQIPIQAAEYVRRFGALVPYDVCPPLLPVLIAALGLVGVPETAGYVAVVLAAYLGGCVAVYALVRRFQPGAVAGFAAVLYALAPSRLPPASLESGSLLVSWSLVPVLLIALDGIRRGPRLFPVAAGLGVTGMIWAARPAGVSRSDLLALAELGVLLAVSFAPGVLPRRVALAGLVAAAGWVFLLGQPAHAPLPAALLSGSGVDAGGGRWFGAVSLDAEMNPVLAQAGEVIDSPLRLEESLLWLRAMAVEFVISDDRQKFSGALEQLDDQDGWGVYGLPDPNPAPAVLVSRHSWKSLPPIRGLFDIEGLNQYLSWAGRPEPAGFRRVGDVVFEVWADLGPLDMFLVRRNCQPGWRAYLEGANSRELAIECDPLGFFVLDAGGEGNARVRLEFQPAWSQRLFPSGGRSRPLAGGDFPRITPGGVIEAVGFTPPPFPPAASLSVFGHNFVPESTRVFFGETPGEILWVGPQQVNVRLPEGASRGELQVVVESAGRRSFPEEIEVVE
jgi:hypothetical protein